MEKEKIYAELTFILEQIPSSYIKVIPQKLIDKFKNNMSIQWYNRFDKDKVFYKQDIKRETLLMLAFLYYKYWCENDEMKADFIKMIEDENI